MKDQIWIGLCLLLLLIGLTGCKTIPKISISPTTAVSQASQTVYRTVDSQTTTPTVAFTPTKAVVTAKTDSDIPTRLPIAPPDTLTPVPTSAHPPAPTPTQICDLAAPGYPKIDVTIDDDTQMQPGQLFTKVWRLTNAGTCTWTKDYAAVWFSGEKLGETTSVSISANVAPGGSVEIAVDMVAPLVPNPYQSNWKLHNAEGLLFGIGPNGDSPFWVRIVVVQASTATLTPTILPTITPTPTATPSSTPTFTPTPVIQASGTFTLTPGASIDLDTAQLNTGEGDDLAYRIEDRYHVLVPLREAQLGIYAGSGQPSPEACHSANMSTAPIPVESLSPGAYLCYQTGQKQSGWAHLNSFNTQDFTINLSILTWASP